MTDKLISLNALRKEVKRNFDMQNLYLPVHILDVAEDIGKELVRCKGCKNAVISDNGLITCNGRFRTPDWYCADGVKRDGEDS